MFAVPHLWPVAARSWDKAGLVIGFIFAVGFCMYGLFMLALLTWGLLRGMRLSSADALLDQLPNLAIAGRVEYRLTSEGAFLRSQDRSDAIRWSDAARVWIDPTGVMIRSDNVVEFEPHRCIFLPAAMLGTDSARVIDAMFAWTAAFQLGPQQAHSDQVLHADDVLFRGEFSLSEHDLERAARSFVRLDRATKIHRRVNRHMFVVSVLLLAASGVFFAFHFADKFRGVSIANALLSTIVLVSIPIGVGVWWEWRRYRGASAALARFWALAGTILGAEPPVQLTVRRGGLSVRTPQSWIHLAWHRITGIHELPEGVLYSLGHRDPFFFLPRGTGYADHDRVAEIILEQVNNLGGPDANRIRFTLGEGDATCPKCQYSLEGLESLICPECGIKLDRTTFAAAFPEAAIQPSLSFRLR